LENIAVIVLQLPIEAALYSKISYVDFLVLYQE